MLYVMRHGETDYNVARRICDHAKAQLTEKGYQQTELVAEKVARQGIRIDRLSVSSLEKVQEIARKTAERSQLTIETKPRSIRMNFDAYDDEPIEAAAFQENRSKISLPFPKGESILDIASRIYPLIEKVLTSEEAYLFICHNTVIRVIDDYFDGKKIQGFLDFRCGDIQLV